MKSAALETGKKEVSTGTQNRVKQASVNTSERTQKTGTTAGKSTGDNPGSGDKT